MAGSVNKVILVGNLGKDPEVRSMQNGGRVCNLTVATSESWKDKNSGERKEKTEWHRVVIFNDNLVTVAEKYLRKGAKVYIEGALETRKWQDQQSGQDKYTTEIVLKQYRGELTMLDGRSGEGGGERGGSSYGSPSTYDDPGVAREYVSPMAGAKPAPEVVGGGSSGSNFELDDEIPF